MTICLMNYKPYSCYDMLTEACMGEMDDANKSNEMMTYKTDIPMFIG